MKQKIASAIVALSCLAPAAWADDSFNLGSPALADAPVQIHRFRDYMSRFIRDEHERGAYLGVSTAPVPPALGRQLGLNRGMGLVVEFVAKDGPAEQAGIKQFDLLQKLDEQLLINSEQLAILVRSYKPGDEVKLSLIRDGKPQTIAVKLAEHELEPLRVPQSLERWEFDPQFVVPPPPHNAPRAALPKPNKSGKSNSTLTWLDDNHTYSIVTRDGHRTITVTDKNNQVVFEGPFDTPEQRDHLPADIKEKVNKMTKSGLLPELP